MAGKRNWDLWQAYSTSKFRIYIMYPVYSFICQQLSDTYKGRPGYIQIMNDSIVKHSSNNVFIREVIIGDKYCTFAIIEMSISSNSYPTVRYKHL